MNSLNLQNVTDNDFVTAVFFDSIRPDKRLTVSEWSDTYRYLSQRASAEPGKYRTSRTPYMREIMDCLSSYEPVQTVVFMKSAQIGATESGNNWVGYVIDHSPGPMLAVQPTVESAKRNSKQRIDPLIESTPKLKIAVADHRSRDASNTVLAKDFPGGTLVMTGANSAVGLRSMPARYLFLDEVDGYPMDADGEGNPIDLALARARTFSKRKVFICSTPTISGRSNVETWFGNSDQRYYYVPCPECGHRQILEFEQLKWTWDDKRNPSDVHYRCVENNCRIDNWQKTQMLAEGEWVKTEPDSKIAGFHINALYSPVGWYSWEDIAEEFNACRKSPERMRTFTNTVLGECWSEETEKPDWNRLYDRRQTYEIGTCPEGVIFITAGGDVQKDRIEVEVVGWGRNKISWSIEYRVIMGDTNTDEPWNELDKLIHGSYELQGSGKFLPIRMTAIDSGYNTQTVYNFVRRYPTTKVIAVKGRDSQQSLVSMPKAMDVQRSGKTARHGIKVWNVGVSLAKEELYGWLRQPTPEDGEPEPLGFCHFPEYDSDYFKMLTAEEMVSKVKKGYKIIEWQKIRERNEALDCRVYARSAANVVGLDRFKEEHWDQLEADTLINAQPVRHVEKKNQVPESSAAEPVKRRRSSWL